jgi:hypothetical protein
VRPRQPTQRRLNGGRVRSLSVSLHHPSGDLRSSSALFAPLGPCRPSQRSLSIPRASAIPGILLRVVFPTRHAPSLRHCRENGHRGPD